MTSFHRNRLRFVGIVCVLAALFPLGGASQTDAGPIGGQFDTPTKELPSVGIESFEAAWQVIYDTHFDTNFNGVDWPAVRAELRPKAKSARNVKQLRTVIEEMIGRLGQSHMALIPRESAVEFNAKRNKDAAKPAADSKDNAEETDSSVADESERDSNASGGSGSAGFDVRLLDGKLTVSRVDPRGPAKEAGIKPGWIVQSIDKRSVSDLLKKLPADLNSREVPFMAWRLAKAQVQGPVGSSLRVKFLDGMDNTPTLEVKRAPDAGQPVKLGHLPTLYADWQKERLHAVDGSSVGLIRFNLWMAPISLPFDKAVDEFRQMDGIILDLRGNLGGLGAMVMGISGHFLNERVSLGKMKTRGNELEFFSNPRRVNPSGLKVEPYSGPLAILIDGVSLSTAEIFAGGMQAIGRARIFGEPSPGQALPALWDKLPNGDILYHAVADFVSPSGIRLEGRGVIPDEPIRATRQDLLEGRDPALLAAMQWIAKECKKKQSAGISSRDELARRTGVSPVLSLSVDPGQAGRPVLPNVNE